MRVKVQDVGSALHPNERVVEVSTTSGKERLVVDKRSIASNSVSIGSPISKSNDLWLIELPRETTSGSWRVWVKENLLIKDSKVRVA